MCTVFLAKNVVDGVPLVVGANRDEDPRRPWQPPRWQADSTVLCPRDLRGGGTWMGRGRGGVTVALTNRDPGAARPQRRSRGLLCYELLEAGGLAAARAHLAAALRRDPYNAFDLLLADADAALVWAHGAGRDRGTWLADGVHSMSHLHGLDAAAGAADRAALAAAAPSGWAPFVAQLRLCLGRHEEAPGSIACCRHGPHFATLSASLIRLPPPAGGSGLYFAAGPPCTAPLVEVAPAP